MDLVAKLAGLLAENVALIRAAWERATGQEP
jgi:hypothetical protein